jgi:flagellin
MTSILTNTAAMTALTVLRQTESALGSTQERISTGLKVNSAKDDASTWAIAQGIKSDISTYKTINDGLTMAASAIKVAADNATKIKDQITSIMDNVAKAQSPGSDRAAIQADIDSALTQINSYVSNASFNGTNLLLGSDTLKVLSSISRDSNNVATANYIDVARKDLSTATGGGLATLKGLDITQAQLVSNTNGAKPQLLVDLVAATAGSASTLAFSYKASSGQEKTVTLNYGNGATKESIADTFVKTFGDQLKADGVDVTQFNSAGTNAGTLTFTAVGKGAAVNQVAPSAGLAGMTQVSQTVLTFSDNNDPTVGQEFEFSAFVDDANYTTKVRVVDASGGTTGTILGTDDKGNQIVALSVSDLDGTAGGIADAMKAALDLAQGGNIYGTAAAGELGTTSASGTLTIRSAAAAASAPTTDRVTGVKLPDSDFSTLLATLDNAAKIATGAAQAFGTAQKQAASQKEFLQGLVDSLNTGVGALIDADITAESARLNALQTQQQLATQSLSIANQGSQLVLSLFR